MPSATVTIDIHASANAIFDLIHDYSRRLEWDPFLRKAQLLHGAKNADCGVESRCVARWAVGGLGMDTVYVSFKRPRIAAVDMVRGPFFLRSFAASIRQEAMNDTTTRVTYRYNFLAKPQWLSWPIETAMSRIFDRETRQRLRALKTFIESR